MDHEPRDESPLQPAWWIRFRKEQRPKIVAANPNITFAEVGRALRLAWSELSDAEKEKYVAETRG